MGALAICQSRLRVGLVALRRSLKICAALGLSLGYVAMGLADTMFVFELPKSMYCLGAAVIMALFLDAPPAKKSS